jgi:ABC-type phosphate transport system substrate-binding protein
MRRLMKGFAVVSVALSLVVGLSGTSFAAPKPRTPGVTSIGSGSDTIYNLMTKLDTLYNGSLGCNGIAPSGTTQLLKFHCYADTTGVVHSEDYYHDRFVEAFPLGSSVGINQLCNQGQSGVSAIQYARSSRAKGATDCTNLVFTGIAADGISFWTAGTDSKFNGGPSQANTHIDFLPWVHLNGNACAAETVGCAPSLTGTQVQAIWSNCGGKAPGAQTWGDITGHAADTTPIDVYAAQSGSGTRSAFESLALSAANSTNCIPAAQKDGSLGNGERVGVENSAQLMLSQNEGHDGTVYYSYGRFQQNQPVDGGRLGAVNGIIPTTDSILGQDSGGNPVPQFPYARQLYDVYTKAKTSYSVGGNTFTRPKANAATIDYMNPTTGWLCKAAASHAVNPLTGDNYRNDIESAISSEGFIPLPLGPVGGGFTGSSFCRAQST